MTATAMPSPRRIVRSSIRLAKRIGMTDTQARTTVMACAEVVYVCAEGAGISDLTWPLALMTAAASESVRQRQAAKGEGGKQDG